MVFGEVSSEIFHPISVGFGALQKMFGSTKYVLMYAIFGMTFYLQF